jgi:MYXO-CTERM domain-containing protein
VGVNSDLIHVSGALTVAAGSAAGSRFTLALTALDAGNAPGLPAHFDPSQAYQWTILTTTGGIVGFDPAKVTLDASRFAAPGNFSLAQAGNVVVLSFTPVPEPSAPLLALAGVATAWSLRRRRTAS